MSTFCIESIQFVEYRLRDDQIPKWNHYHHYHHHFNVVLTSFLLPLWSLFCYIILSFALLLIRSAELRKREIQSKEKGILSIMILNALQYYWLDSNRPAYSTNLQLSFMILDPFCSTTCAGSSVCRIFSLVSCRFCFHCDSPSPHQRAGDLLGDDGRCGLTP